MPNIYQAGMVSEISSIFFMIRTLKGKNDWKGPIATLNMLAFFLSYTVFRVMMFPILILSNVRLSYVYDFSSSSTLHKVIFYINNSVFTGVYFLNLFWYYLIVKGFWATIKPKKEAGDKYQKVVEKDVEGSGAD